MSVFAYSQSDGEIEWHAPIVAPPSAPVHAAVGRLGTGWPPREQASPHDYLSPARLIAVR